MVYSILKDYDKFIFKQRHTRLGLKRRITKIFLTLTISINEDKKGFCIISIAKSTFAIYLNKNILVDLPFKPNLVCIG